MKNSGIPWIGEIPEGWKVENIKSIYTERNERSINGSETLLSLSQYTGVKPKAETEIADSHIAETYEGYKIVSKGDFVMNIMLAWNGSYAVSNYDGMISPAYCVFKFRDDKHHKRYYHYLLRTEGYPSAFKTLSRGIMDSRLRLYPEQFYTFPTILPPLSEQQAIADFLDKKCAEIDQMVALQEKFIEELKAYKQSLITETVTKGLNTNAPMKDSGVEGIGEVPAGWDVILLPFVFRNLDYLIEPISAEQRSRKNPIYDYYGASGIIDKIDFYNVDDDVLLIGEDGANLRMRNLPLIYRATGKFWVNNHAHILKPIKDNINFMQYMLEALDYNDFITGSAQPKLSQDNLAKVRVCVPPLPEQQAIADFLDKKCAEIDQLIAVKQKKADELKEYKKSIIYEYVTGKRSVCE